MTSRGALHYSPEVGDEASLAALFDVVRGLLVDAVERGESVDQLVIDSSLHELLKQTKDRELRHGRPLTVLGLAVSPPQRNAPPGPPNRTEGAA